LSAVPRGLFVLVSGVVFGQERSGVRRHNEELLPRAARLLEEGGGGLGVLVGRVPPSFALPPSVTLHASRVPAGPPIARAIHEGSALAAALAQGAAAGRSYRVIHTAHLPTPRRLSVPFTLTVHDLRSLLLARRSLSRRLFARRVLRRAIADASCVLTVSEGVRREIERRFRPRRTVLVGNGADHLPLLPRRPGRDAPLLFVGQIEPRKNLGLLLEALKLDPGLPDLELVGIPRGSARAELEEQARVLDVGRRVRFLGAVEDGRLAELYARCACVVLPSWLEGFGIPVVEALRAGAPLAIADAGALPEVAGGDVPRFAPDDPAGCVAAIRTALERAPGGWEAARARAESHRWQDAAERMVAAWAEVAETPSGRVSAPRSAP